MKTLCYLYIKGFIMANHHSLWGVVMPCMRIHPKPFNKK